MNAWFIENPITKDLVKSLTMRVGPMSEKEFIIVMKAPNDRVAFNMTAFLNLRLVSLREYNKRMEKKLRNNGQHDDIEDIKLEGKSLSDSNIPQEIKVMLIGRLENPRVVCTRELHLKGTECEMIPLAVKKNIP